MYFRNILIRFEPPTPTKFFTYHKLFTLKNLQSILWYPSSKIILLSVILAFIVYSRIFKNTKSEKIILSKIEELMQFIQKNPIQILTTLREDSTPNARPFGSAMLFGDKIWYCMNNDKNTFYEIKANPHICLCSCNEDRSWLRIYAKAIFEDNKQVKSIYLSRPTNSFTSVNDPRFSVFYLSQIQAEIHTKNTSKLIKIS